MAHIANEEKNFMFALIFGVNIKPLADASVYYSLTISLCNFVFIAKTT